MNTLFKTLFLALGLTVISYGISEYIDYRIKTELANELAIDSKYITFLYETDEECEEDETLWDEYLGICINNNAFGLHTDTNVGMVNEM